MDLLYVVNCLRAELADVEEAIASLERLGARAGKRGRTSAVNSRKGIAGGSPHGRQEHARGDNSEGNSGGD